MKFRLPILLSVVFLFALGTYSATRAYDPPKSSSGSSPAKEANTEKPQEEASKSDSAKSEEKTKKSSSLNKSKKMSDPFNKLTADEAYVILKKGTEAREKGYTHTKTAGTYICKRCNAPLYNSTDKFESHCGWPSFDDEIKGAVKKQLETDGSGRIEIVCQNCGGHLGHVFQGEQYTAKNTRHCVNSISMKLIPEGKELPEVIKADKEKDSAKAAEKSDNKASIETPILKSGK
jgi:peptide-methionine (R)-S-oxide reductase